MSYRHDPPHELMSGGRDGRVDRSYRIPFFIPEGALVPFGSALRGLIGTLDSGTELISYWVGLVHYSMKCLRVAGSNPVHLSLKARHL
jgi:hypothetical protein